MITKKLICLLGLVLLSSASAIANNGDAETKKFFVLQTIVGELQISSYQQHMERHQLNRGENIVVSVDDFKDFFIIYPTYKKILMPWPKIEFSSRLQRFIDSNNLNNTMATFSSIRHAQNIFTNILFLIEVQKMILARTDLHEFGFETIQNLNKAITQTIKSQYLAAEKFLSKTVFSRQIGTQMKENFINIGLGYEKYLELYKSNTTYRDPMNILDTLVDLSGEKIILNLKKSKTLTCAALFY